MTFANQDDDKTALEVSLFHSKVPLKVFLEHGTIKKTLYALA